MTPLLLCIAMTIDALFGEPEAVWRKLPHPAVIMGRLVDRCDQRWNQGTHRRLKGTLALCVLCIGALLGGAALSAAPLGWLWSVILAAILLAQRSLVQHVTAVADGLRLSLDEGRTQVSMIVGRDTSAMDAASVARAAIESAAENLSDGLVAPAFWFLVGGLPGILLYKIVNTADSMIGYRTERHREFGWAAARLDDVLNWIPARLTAVLIIGLYGLWSAGTPIVADARRHRSPNAGWPEAAAARALDVALSGPRSYDGQMQDYPYVHPTGAGNIGPTEIDRAVGLLWRVWLALFGATLLLVILPL